MYLISLLLPYRNFCAKFILMSLKTLCEQCLCILCALLVLHHFGEEYVWFHELNHALKIIGKYLRVCSNVLQSLVNIILIFSFKYFSENWIVQLWKFFKFGVFNNEVVSLLLSTKIVPWDFSLLDKIICDCMKLSVLSFCVCTLTAGTSRVFSPHVPASMAATGKYSLLTYFAVTLNLDAQYFPTSSCDCNLKENTTAASRVLIV